MKLVINVDNYKFEACKRRKEEGQNAWYHDMVLNGKPLEKERVKELNDIKAEIGKKSNVSFYENKWWNYVSEVFDNRIAELKGENK